MASKSDLRRLMQHKKASNKVDHPLARYPFRDSYDPGLRMVIDCQLVGSYSFLLGVTRLGLGLPGPSPRPSQVQIISITQIYMVQCKLRSKKA